MAILPICIFLGGYLLNISIFRRPKTKSGEELWGFEKNNYFVRSYPRCPILPRFTVHIWVYVRTSRMQIRKKWLNQLKNFFNKHFWEYYLASFCWWISSSCENHCTLVQSHIWLTTSSYCTVHIWWKYLCVSPYIRKPFLIYDFAPDPIWIALYYWGKFCFLFISDCKNLNVIFELSVLTQAAAFLYMRAAWTIDSSQHIYMYINCIVPFSLSYAIPPPLALPAPVHKKVEATLVASSPFPMQAELCKPKPFDNAWRGGGGGETTYNWIFLLTTV